MAGNWRNSAVARAARRPTLKAEKGLRWARAATTLLALGSTVLAVVQQNGWWLALACGCLALWGWASAVMSERDLLAIEHLAAEFDVSFQKLAASPLGLEFDGHPMQSVMFKVRNNGAQCRLRASCVEESVTGVHIPYPNTSFLLRWQIPSGEVQTINRGGNARVDVAYIVPGLRLMFFVGPPDAAHPEGQTWMGLEVTSSDGYVEGLIDLEEIDRDVTRRVRFRMSTGLVDPVDLEVLEVDHPAFPP